MSRGGGPRDDQENDQETVGARFAILGALIELFRSSATLNDQKRQFAAPSEVTLPPRNVTPERRRPLTPEQRIGRLTRIAEATDTPLVVHPVQLHAYNLLLALQAEFPGREVLASDGERIYLDLCTENWWKPHRWRHKNGVAHHLRLLNGHGKTYRYVEADDGKLHRLSVYSISRPAPAARRRSEVRDQTPVVTLQRRATAAYDESTAPIRRRA